MEMEAEGSLEAEGGIGHRQARFGVSDPRAGIDQDSGSVHRLRLIGMEHGHRVEAALQSTGGLSRHERHGWPLDRQCWCLGQARGATGPDQGQTQTHSAGIAANLQAG